MFSLRKNKAIKPANASWGLILVASIVASGFGFLAGLSPAFAQEGTPSETPNQTETGSQGGADSQQQPLAVPETIAFSQNSTVSPLPVRLAMNKLVGGTIRYTVNGALPLASSPAYTTPLFIDTPTVIRAQVFDNDGTPLGFPYTKSYIIAPYEPTISVISIVTDWTHLDALHANPNERGKEWERPMTMDYFAPGGSFILASTPA